MENMVRKYFDMGGWTQQRLADAINDVLERHTALKKVTKKNPEGLVDQQTAGRLVSGKIALDERWIAILGIVLDKTPNELMGIEKEEASVLYARDIMVEHFKSDAFKSKILQSLFEDEE